MYTAVIFWTVTEGTLAIISACLPTLRPLFDRRNKTKLSTSRRFKIRYWSASQGNRDSDSSVVGFGTAGLTIKDSGFHTHIEANRMENLRHSRDGIMVRKDISLQWPYMFVKVSREGGLRLTANKIWYNCQQVIADAYFMIAHFFEDSRCVSKSRFCCTPPIVTRNQLHFAQRNIILEFANPEALANL